ncbi:MAG: response regulator [Myxococcales bacterium]|nr:response regulator [Myxococcales bacterium]MCB9718491.1 response regulator [Myxococcales bacterium]
MSRPRSLAEQDLEALRFVERVLPGPALLLSVLVVIESKRPWITTGLLVLYVAFNMGLSRAALRRGRALLVRTNELRYLFDMVLLVVLGVSAGPEAPAVLMAVPPACGAPFLFRDWRAWVAIVGVCGAAFLGSLLAGAELLELVPIVVAEIGVGVVLVAAVVELRRREAEREVALAHATQASQARSEFLSVMSHEIRTPLHGMMGTLSLIEQGEVDELTRARLGTISECGRDVLRLLCDILQLSQMQSGELEPLRRAFSAAELVHEALERARIELGPRELELVEELDEGLADCYRGPADAIHQVLDRLLDNAIAFTPRGRITVEARPGADGLRFAVRDTGSGIPRAELSGIFDAFNQVDATTTRSHGGLGLGLTISKRTVEALGGRIEATSELGKGSTFAFTVPCEAIAVTEEQSSDELELRVPVPSSGTVLVVDDNAINRRVMAGMLERLGYAVDTVDDGQQAVERTRDTAYPLILMDCYMPIMDGYQATRIIRERDGHRSRIIGVTADALVDARKRCLDAGMDDYLPKPVSLQLLGERLGRAAAPAPG